MISQKLALTGLNWYFTKPIVIDLNKVGYTSFSGAGVANILMAGPGPALKFVGTHPGGSPSKNVWERQRMPLVDGVAILGEHNRGNRIPAIRRTRSTCHKAEQQ